MASAYADLFNFDASGARPDGSSVGTQPTPGIDWRSIIRLLGNTPTQVMQVPFQPLQSQYPGTNAVSQQLPTPAMLAEERQKQTSSDEIEQWARFIAQLFA